MLAFGLGELPAKFHRRRACIFYTSGSSLKPIEKGDKKRLPQIAARPAAHLASIDAETSWENICFSARRTAGPKVRP